MWRLGGTQAGIIRRASRGPLSLISRARLARSRQWARFWLSQWWGSLGSHCILGRSSDGSREPLLSCSGASSGKLSSLAEGRIYGWAVSLKRMRTLGAECVHPEVLYWSIRSKGRGAAHHVAQGWSWWRLTNRCSFCKTQDSLVPVDRSDPSLPTACFSD